MGSAFVQQTFGFDLDLGPLSVGATPGKSDAEAVDALPGLELEPVKPVVEESEEAESLAVERAAESGTPPPVHAGTEERRVDHHDVMEPDRSLEIPEPQKRVPESIRSILRRPSRNAGDVFPAGNQAVAEAAEPEAGVIGPAAGGLQRPVPLREVWREPEPEPEVPLEGAEPVTVRISPATAPSMGRPGSPPWKHRQSLGKVRTRRRRRSGGLLLKLLKLRWLLLVPVLAAVSWLAWKVATGTLWKRATGGRDAVAAAVLEEAKGASASASEMMKKAVQESAGDPEALRLAADYYLPRGDEKAAGVVGLLMKGQDPTELDQVRAAEFALVSSYPEFMPAVVQQWLHDPVESSLPRRLIAEARWLARCGQHDEAESRLRSGLLHRPNELSIDMALCALMVRPAAEGEQASSRILEGLQRLEKLQTRVDLPLRDQIEAAGLRVEAMKQSHAVLRAGDEVVDGLRHSVRAMFSRLDEEQKLGLELRLRAMDLAIRPEQREQIVREAVATWPRLEAPAQLRVGRWLAETGNHDEVLRLFDRTAKAATDPDWVRLRMESLLAQERFPSVRTAAVAEPRVLPPVVRALYLYRAESGEAALAAGVQPGGNPAVAAAAGEVQTEARKEATPAQLLEAGREMAKRGDWIPADLFLRFAEHDAEVGMLARVERIRVLRTRPDQEAEQRKALEALLALWPQADGFRSELLHLKLLAGEAESDDYALAEQMATWVAPDAWWKVTAALAELRRGRQPAAQQLLEGLIPAQGECPAGWLVVQAAVLAAGNRQSEAQAVRDRLGERPLRAGERALLRQYLPTAS
jgi:hypothetical protein